MGTITDSEIAPAPPRRPPVTWVTGGASGIGRAVVAGAVSRGHTVGVLDLVEPAEHGHFAHCNLADEASVSPACDRLHAQTGEPSQLVLGAAVASAAPIAHHEVRVWRNVIDTNLTGPFLLLRRLLDDVCSSGQGRIVTISSGSAIRVGAGSGAYAASKAGLIALTKAVAMEVAPYGATANVVAPGVTRTPMASDMFGNDEAIDRAATEGRLANPQQCALEPEDIADAVLFLLSEHAARITGQVIHVNGGSLMP